MDVQPVTLTGQAIQLVPLTESHVDDLALVGLHVSIWRYMVFGNVENKEQMRSWVLDMLNGQKEGGSLPFAVVYKDTGKAVGTTRYLNISVDDRSLEIGSTWYGLEYQRTVVNTEAKYLLLEHAFEMLGCVRVQLKTDLRNLNSQRAIERIGAVKEGILRKHMVLPDGFIRDSVIYSIIDEEWLEVKTHLKKLISQRFS